MNSKLSTLSLAILAAFTLGACTSNSNVVTDTANNVTLTQEQLAGAYLVGATAWVQNAAEYRALAYQAFNVATVAYDQAPNVRGKAKAVVVDLDETMIDNGGFQGAIAKYGIAYNSKDWGNWEKTGKPTAIPGALEFAKHVVSKGGVVYYVSNRQHANLEYTKASLIALGFPGVSDATVLLKDKVSSKEPRFEVANSKHNVVVYVGDNLRDFPEAGKFNTTAERNAWVDQNKKYFGNKFIVLPNPMYGNWLSSLAPNFYSHSLAEQNKIKVDAIKAWDLSNYK
ncbi:5'-nucleotidase, lipoprotein e(P4) family [Psittacicella gerlachiana]|uniref:5'-nucleotidase, lipoprotein e(P4) family n=1 Tax=Psittacicella gerlachiana TaxID=2028574 RepID=UPI001CA661D1|nr:5'-nucleotidase, lipoprotein e(P4) family [Psittacicella gerlachiana]